MKLFNSYQRIRSGQTRKTLASTAALALFGMLPTVSVFADGTQDSAHNSSTNISTVDNPLPYRHLDWLSAEEIQALPEAERPILNGVCEGAYLAPTIGTSTNEEALLAPESFPIEATADHYQANGDGTIELIGDVIIQQGGRQLESDRITINQHTRETSLLGNVRIRESGMLMAGEEAELNLNEKNLSLKSAEYVVHDSRIRGTAEHIYNESQSTLVFSKSSYTTCEPKSNAWLFEASDIRLNQASGWGTAKHAIIRVKDVPVFYFPWLMFPIDDRRQSGFLFPSFSSGEENGTKVALPYYFNLAPNYDATLTPRHMSERGTQLEGEFRYLTNYGEGELGAAYLPNDNSFNDETRNLNLWKHEGSFAKRWSAEVDYTKVSDDDYFDDLATSLNAKSQTHLDQKAGVKYTANHWNASLNVERHQTLDELLTDADLPYRKMPQFSLNGEWNHGQSGFYSLFQSEITRFEHPEEDFNGVTDADRITLAPGIEYRYRKPWASATPRLRVIYSEFDFDSAIEGQSIQEDQTLYTASLDAQLFFERPATIGNSDYTQTLEPRLFYLYTPFEEQSHRQTFDSGRITFDYNQLFRENRFTGGDRYGDANQVSLGLTTRFINKNTGWEQFRASMGQIFYFDDRRVQLTESDAVETDERSAWVGQTEWRFNQHWRMLSELQWNENVNNIDRASASVNYESAEHGLFNASYRYLDDGASTFSGSDKIKQTDISFLLPANENWSVIGRWGYDLEYERSFENLVGVEYDSCCWRVRLVNRRYLKEDSDDPLMVEPQRGVFLQFQLKGLGGIGNELDDILNESIRGFENRESSTLN